MSTLTAGNVTVSCSLSADTSGNLVFQSGGNVTAMTIDSSQNVGIGTSSPQKKLSVSNSGAAGVEIDPFTRSGTTGGALLAYNRSGAAFVRMDYDASEHIFFTSASERARINSGGYFKTANDGNYNDAAGNYCEFLNTNNNQILRLVASNASYTSNGIELLISRNTTNNTFYAFSYYNTGAAAFKFRVADSGNVTNTNNSYGAISDIKLKENVVDATSKLEKLNQVRVVNYNFIGSEQKQLGVIAQELEQIFPGMVEESPDRDAEGNDLGTTTKSVKYSVFVPMLIKAMQEQQQMIETLQAKVAALEAA
jgi:hypothetical protein